MFDKKRINYQENIKRCSTGLKTALELILKYYLLNKTKILSIVRVKIFKMINCTRYGCFSSTSREF